MANYAYTARTKDGTIVKDLYEAADKAMVVTALKNKGYIPLKVTEKSGFNSDINFDIIGQRVTTKDISVFCRQFSAVIEAGIPVLECLDIVRKQTESKKMREIINKVYEQVQKGRSLSESFKEFKNDIPPMMINMIEAGEASGTLDKVMARLAVYFANSNKTISKVKGAMIYPIVLFCVSVLAVIALLWLVVPKFKDMLSSMGTDLPVSTKVLMAISDFVANNIILILILLVGSVVGIMVYSKTANGKYFFDNLFLSVQPFSGMFKKMIAARFTRTMASLLSAGVPLIEALEITEKVINNSVMSKYLEKVREDVTKGSKLSVAISNVKVLPTMVVNMISIGEESGTIDGILDKTADFFEEETEAAIAGMTTMLEPAVILVMATLVGGVIISIVQPMFKMISAANSM